VEQLHGQFQLVLHLFEYLWWVAAVAAVDATRKIKGGPFRAVLEVVEGPLLKIIRTR
jgi:hypothetical protein